MEEASGPVFSEPAKLESHLRTAIVGGGPGCERFLRMSRTLVGRFPMEIVGVADIDDGAPGVRYAREIGIGLITTDYRELLSIPRLDLLIELTGSWEVRDDLERTRPAGVRLIDHFAARLFWELHQAEESIIRQRTEMRERVEQESERIKQFFDAIPDEIVVVDTDMVIQFANASYLRNTDRKLGEVQGCFCYDLEQEVRGDCQVAVGNCPAFAAIESKQPSSLVRKHFDDQGNVRYAAITAAPLIDREAEVVGVIEMTRDITQRNVLEEELRATEVRLKEFLEHAPLAIYVKNRHLQYLEANPATLALLRRSKSGVIGKTDLEILPRRAAEVVRAGDREAWTERKVVKYEADFDISGERVSLSTITYPVLSPDGEVNAVCGLTMDVTAQKRAEAELRQTREYLQNILDNASALIITSDLESNIVAFNRGAERNLGYTAEEVIGRPAPMLFVDPAERQRVVETVGQHGVAEDVEVTMRRKDGSELPVSITMSQLKDSHGCPIGLVGVSRDISQRKALMDQIIQAERLASVGRLAAGVAHEINNPLAVIGELSGYLEDIAGGLAPGGAERLDREVRIALPKITAQIRRCRSITRRLLSFARKTEGQVETADVAVALDEVLPFLAKQAQLARIEIHRAIPDDLPVVAIEEVQLEEVLINLINNAIQAVAPEGGGNIWIEAERVKRKVVITVRDDGPGIPDDVRHRLFDPFFTTKEQGEGTGLGLSICYGILKRHDGEIRVESQEGRGAKFLVILKVHQPTDKAATSK